MNMRNTYYIFMLTLLLFGACKNTNASGTQQRTDANQTTAEVAQTDTLSPFKLPEIPSIITEREKRVEYLVDNYWQHFDFNDTLHAHPSKATEQIWSDYINVLEHAPLGIASKGMKSTFEKAATHKKVFYNFVTLADKYLYDPNSPYRNEELYIQVLEAMLKSSHYSDIEKIRPAARLKQAQKNRVGTMAKDFAYATATNRQGTLHAIDTRYTLIYFNNPGCHSCEETATSLKRSLRIQHLLAEKQITILGIYPDGDVDEWQKHQADFPKEWINGYDEEQIILNEGLYDLKAMPTLYLLDKNKTVLLKDATVEQLEAYLRAQK